MRSRKAPVRNEDRPAPDWNLRLPWATTAGVAVSIAGTLVAIFLVPWAHYGSISVDLLELSIWPSYVVLVSLLHLSVVILVPSVRTWPSWLPLISGILVLAAVAAAVIVMFEYDDSRGIFGPFVPPILPVIGAGGPLAVIAALINVPVILQRFKYERKKQRSMSRG